MLVALAAAGMAYRWYHARERSLQRAHHREPALFATAMAAMAGRASGDRA